MSKMWKISPDRKFFELQAEQRSKLWFNARINTVTASGAEVVVTGESRFTTIEKHIETVRGTAPKMETNENMQLGIDMEDPTREVYTRGMGVHVIEPGLCVGLLHPDQLKDPLHAGWFIGGSPDGLVTDSKANPTLGSLEIKFPKRLYYILKQKLGNPHFQPVKQLIKNTESKEHTTWFGHIFLSHYLQMQQCMAVTGREWSDYVVGSLDSQTYVERVPFDKSLWNNVMYPALVLFIEKEIKPRMTESQLSERAKRSEMMIGLYFGG
jgi:hypothetical protein